MSVKRFKEKKKTKKKKIFSIDVNESVVAKKEKVAAINESGLRDCNK